MKIQELTILTGVETTSPQLIFEMSSLSSKLTGLRFYVWVSPRAGSKHSARIKVTMPPYGANPEAIYQIKPFQFIEGNSWLGKTREQSLERWVALNEKPLLDFWNEIIIDDEDLKSQITRVDNAPPSNRREAIIAFRSIAPKVRAVSWYGQAYHLYFEKFAPEHSKIAKRFASLDFPQSIELHVINPTDTPKYLGIVLWQKT